MRSELSEYSRLTAVYIMPVVEFSKLHVISYALGASTLFPARLLGRNSTPFSENLRGHKPSLALPEFVLDFRNVASFRNLSDSCRKLRPHFTIFDPCKIYGRDMGETSESILQFQPTSNPLILYGEPPFLKIAHFRLIQ